jgi:manganese efflux pump family protein
MSPISITVLAIGMSIDALLASIGRGAGLRRPCVGEAMKAGFVFGLVETITPFFGWVAGVAKSRYVAAVDHWIAFGLLAFVGGRMILHAFQRSPEKPGLQRNGSLLVLLATALGVRNPPRSTVLPLLPSQSREGWIVALAIAYAVQH